MDDAIADNGGDEADEVPSVLNMTQNIGTQFQLILEKLRVLEAKFETVVEIVNNLASTVESLKTTVDKMQSEVAAVERKSTTLKQGP